MRKRVGPFGILIERPADMNSPGEFGPPLAAPIRGRIGPLSVREMYQMRSRFRDSMMVITTAAVVAAVIWLAVRPSRGSGDGLSGLPAPRTANPT